MPKPPRLPFLLWVDTRSHTRAFRLAMAGSIDAPDAPLALNALRSALANARLGNGATRDATPTGHLSAEGAHTLEQGRHLVHTAELQDRMDTPCVVVGIEMSHKNRTPPINPWAIATRWTDRIAHDAARLMPSMGPWTETIWTTTPPSLDDVRATYSRLPGLLRDPTRT